MLIVKKIYSQPISVTIFRVKQGVLTEAKVRGTWRHQAGPEKKCGLIIILFA